MTTLRIFVAKLRALFGRRRLDLDLQQEIAGHLDEATEDYLRQGLSPAEARRAALINFGGVAQTEDAHRERRAFRWWDQLRRDGRQATRALRRAPGFSAVVIVVLATGTGALASVFTLLDRIVLRPLPYTQPDRLVVVKHSAPGLGRDEVGLSSGLYFYYSQYARSFDGLAVYDRSERLLNLRVPGAGTERVHVAFASAALFHVLDVTPALGRLFTEEDGRPGFMNTTTWTVPVLLAHRYWVDHFGSDPNIVGRLITLNDHSREVVGVLPDGFTFPRAGTEIWMLAEPPKVTANFAGNFGYNTVARLRAGATAASAQAELASILPQIAGAYEDATPQRIAQVRLAPVVTPLKAAVIGDIAPVLWTLLAGMACVLLIACASAASLFAIRADDRRREIGVRQALGARRHDVARLFFLEALVLTTSAAALGWLVAKGLVWSVVTLAPVELPRSAEIRLDAAGVFALMAIAGLMAGFYSGISVRYQDRSLGGGRLGGGRWATGARGGRWTRDPLLVVQVALALALMAGSALMVQTYRNLSRRELGFSPGHVLTVEIGLPSRESQQHARIYRAVVDQLRQLPGVESASAASFLPLTPSEHVFLVPGSVTPVPFKFFVPGYFAMMGTPVVEGHGVAVNDTVTAPFPVVVSAALARRLFPGESAVGKKMRRLNENGSVVEMGHGPVPAFTIVGVVGDVREATLRDDAMEAVYIPVIEPSVEQSIVPTNMSLVIRVQGAALTYVAPVRSAIAAVDPALSVGRVRPMDAIVGAARGREAFVGALLLLAAGVALFLGVVGVYGSVAHVVHARTREIGVRVALGASRRAVMRMVMAGALRTVCVGAALGLAVALAGTGLLRALLFDVQPRDPLVLLTVVAILVFAAGAAALLAARHAATIAPLTAMQSD